MGTLTASDIRKCRIFFASISKEIDDSLNGLIDDVTRDELVEKQQNLSNIVQMLTKDALTAEIKDLATPMAEIEKSIDKVNDALQRLDDVRRGIDLFSEIINFGSKLVSAVSGGVVPILGTVLQAINFKADNIS